MCKRKNARSHCVEKSKNGKMMLKFATLKRLIGSVLATEDKEITCDECFQHVDRFAELTLAGEDAGKVLPLVKAHLDRCPDCRAEFEALLDALHALEDGDIVVSEPPGIWKTVANRIKRFFGLRKT